MPTYGITVGFVVFVGTVGFVTVAYPDTTTPYPDKDDIKIVSRLSVGSVSGLVIVALKRFRHAEKPGLSGPPAARKAVGSTF